MSHIVPRIVSTIATRSLLRALLMSALAVVAAACNSDSADTTRDPIQTSDGSGSPSGSDGGSGGDSSTSNGDGGPSTNGGSTPEAGETAEPDETCWFEDPGDWVVCENAKFPYIESVESTSTQDCADICLAEPRCTAIYDYYWRGWDDFGCSLHLSTCDAAEFSESAEGDGAKTFRKVCGASPPPDAITEFEPAGGIVVDPDSGCVFRSPVPPEVCDTHGDPDLEIVGGSSLSECLELCQGREDCTAVKDKPVGDFDGMECLLHLASCDDLVPDELETSEDLTYYYRKVCEETGGN